MADVPKRLSLEPGEEVTGAWVAAVPFLGGRLAKFGGTLVLTDRRLIFEPLNVRAPGVTRTMKAFEAGYRGATPLSEIERVEPVVERRALMRIRLRDGEQVEWLLAAGRATPAWSRKNTATRDEAVAAIAAALAAGGS